jgi:hypothetical protein
MDDQSRAEGFRHIYWGKFCYQYTFGLISPWQQYLLINSKEFSLDATYSVNRIGNGILYTIVVKHNTNKTGCPVEYMLTTGHSAGRIELNFVRRSGLTNPIKFTIDICQAELDAIDKVYLKVSVQWRLFLLADGLDENNQRYSEIWYFNSR